ncbi:MAG: hypothetical protein Q8R14_03800, partial [Candidatus Omnitrophota bacterium]|nr:hypothetical protein [Candidatus Omnitrophota bacterium]
MKKTNRIISTLLILCFVVNTVAQDLAFSQTINFQAKNSDKLAAPLMSDDIIGIEHKDIGDLEMWFTASLAYIRKNGLDITVDNLKKFYRSKGRDIFNVEGTRFFINEVKDTGDDAIRILVRIRDNEHGLRAYYIEYSRGNHSIEVYPERKAEWDMTMLLETIVNIPELRGSGIDVKTIRKYVIGDNRDGFYYRKGMALFAVKIDGKFGRLLGLGENKDLPLYYTITAKGVVDYHKMLSGGASEENDMPIAREELRAVRQTTDLASDMVKKSLIAEVFFKGGKTILASQDENNFLAVNAVYGDERLLKQRKMLAKGGLRIFAENTGLKQEDRKAILNNVDFLVRAFIDLRTLGFSSALGP